MAVLVDFGLRAGGGIGDVSLPADFLGGGKGFGKAAFDLLFFVIVIIMFLNMVFGIIVDTFAELRQRREFIDNDHQRKCFICGMDQNVFDRVSSGGFAHHIKYEHNMWHYLYFLHYIKLKKLEDLNGQEHHVFQMMSLKEPSFFPIGRAMILSADNDDAAKTQMGSHFESVLNQVIGQRLQTIEASVTEFSERLAAFEKRWGPEKLSDDLPTQMGRVSKGEV